MKHQVFGIIGGDTRHIYLANSLLEDGHHVVVSGLEKAELSKNVVCADISEVAKAKYVILPIPVTRDGVTLNAPYSEKSIPLDDEFARKLSGVKIYCGLKERLLESSDVWKLEKIQDYYAREELTVKNAVVTAEGAIQIAMNHIQTTINGSRCLVVGYGRIGKSLSQMLKSIGAQVTISARKASDIAWISSQGFIAIKTQDIVESAGKYDLIFNTVPSMVLDKYAVDEMREECVMIELASFPGGIDLTRAKQNGITVLQAPSLPSITAPKTAGDIIKETIYNMIREEMT